MEDILVTTPVDLSKACIFVMIKPGFTDYTDKIIHAYTLETLEHPGWTLVGRKTKTLTLDEAKIIYERQSYCNWFDDACKYLTSDETIGLLFVRDESMSQEVFFEAEDIKNKLRTIYNAQVINAGDVATLLHCADDFEDLKREVPIYFGEDVFQK